MPSLDTFFLSQVGYLLSANCLFILFSMSIVKTSNMTLQHNFVQSKMRKQCHDSQNSRCSFGHHWLCRLNKYTMTTMQHILSAAEHVVMLHSCLKHLCKKSVHLVKTQNKERTVCKDDKMPDHHHIAQHKQSPAC